MKFKPFIFYSSFIPTIIFSQISGTVIDLSSGEPIPNVNVVSGDKGTSTNLEGDFIIDVIDGTELEFSHIAYKKVKKTAQNGMLIKLILHVIKSNEVMVKAGLSDESLHNVTTSISVITSIEIQKSGADHFQTLIDAVPNLNWAGGTSRPRYFQIRGVGERSHYFGEGQPNFSVGFVLDDMDLSGLGMVGHLYDMGQIEIYKGPQSSFFGANALAGLISMKSKDPSKKTELGASTSYGTDNHRSLKAFFNLNIIEKLSLRFMANYNYIDGFRKNLTLKINNSNKKNELITRMKLHLKPSNKLNVLATFIHSNLDNGYDAWAPDNNLAFKTYSDDSGEDSQKTFGCSINTNLLVSNDFNLKSITSYTETDLIHSYDGDWADSLYWASEHGWTPESLPDSIFFFNNKFQDTFIKSRSNFAQELRSYYGNLTFGLYCKKLKEIDEANGYIFGGDATSATGVYDFTALAIYTEYSFDLTSVLRFKANLRIEANQHDYSGTFQNLDYYYQTIILDPISVDKKDNMIGYLTSLNYMKNMSTRFYGSFSQGYKSGGINQQPHLIDTNRPYNPELIQNIEFGLKRKTSISRTNLALFLSLRKNQQVSISNQADKRNPNSFLFYTSNAGNGKTMGIEVEHNHNISQFLLIKSTFSTLNTWLNRFSYPNSDLDGNIIIGYGGNRESAMAPKIMSSISINYEIDDFYFSTITSYKSEYYFSDSHDQKSEPYFLTDFILGKSFKPINIKFWVRNLFDVRYAVRGFYFGLIPPNYPNQLWKSFGDPRSYGITIDLKL